MNMKRILAVLSILAVLCTLITVPALAYSYMEAEITADTNVRKGPGTNYASKYVVDEGDCYEYKGITKYDSRGVAWHKIHYGSASGWVSSKNCRIYVGGYALSNSDYIKTTASVNLRKGPGTGYGKVSSASKGKKLFFLGDTDTDERGVKWFRVATSQGPAWVSSKLSKKNGSVDPDPDPQPVGVYVRTTGSVNLRKGPGLDYGKVVALSKGKNLTYLGENSVDWRGVTWFKVKYGKYTGWVSSVYAKLMWN